MTCFNGHAGLRTDVIITERQSYRGYYTMLATVLGRLHSSLSPHVDPPPASIVDHVRPA